MQLFEGNKDRAYILPAPRISAADKTFVAENLRY